MARAMGPSEASREVKVIVAAGGSLNGLFRSKGGRPATLYTDKATTQVADILLEDGTPVANGTVTIDQYSMLPVIQFPDGVDTLYVVVDDGPAWPVYAREDDRLDALATSAAAKVPKGTLLLDIRDFGAMVDGATDDTTAVQAAIAASTAGTRIFYPPGTCIVSATLLPKAGTTHFGVRGKSILKAKSGVTGFNIFQPTAVSSVAFEDLILDLNKAGTTNPGGNTVGLGIYMANTAGATGLAVRRVEVMNGWQIGIRFLGNAGQTDPSTLAASEVTVEQCYVHDCNGQGIFIANTTRAVIDRNIVRSNGIDGVLVSMGRDVQVTGNTAESNTGYGLIMTYLDSLRCSGNNARSNGSWGIGVGGGSTTNTVGRRYIVSENTCSANGSGGIVNDPTITGLPGIPQDTPFILNANICFNNLVNHGIYSHNTKNTVIASNICFGNTLDGIALHGLRGVVAGNLTYSNSRYGIDVQADGTEVPTYGTHRFTGNMSYGNTTSDFFISSSVTNVGNVDSGMLRMESGSSIGFYGATPITKPTGVAVSAAAIHAALVSLGLIGA